MILSVRVGNYMVYSDNVELYLVADEDKKRFEDNVYTDSGFRVLKSACVYGGNNSGKTCLVKAIKCIRDVILDRSKSFRVNAFNSNRVVDLGVSFLRRGHAYSYDFKYDVMVDEKKRKVGFIYECLSELYADGETEILFLRDSSRGDYRFKNDGIPKEEQISETLMKGFPQDRSLIYAANDAIYGAMVPYKEILLDFAENVSVIDTNTVPIKKTTIALRDGNSLKDKIIALIKAADLEIDDFRYVKGGEDSTGEEKNDDDTCDDEYSSAEDYVKYLNLSTNHFYSSHRGISFQSYTMDSVGTNKIVAMASYIVDALTNGKTLVIDEFDSGLHFELTRALVLMFNSRANGNGGQLIFSTHDVALLDCEMLFRQDQIWFVCNDDGKVYLYSLAELGYKEEEPLSVYDLLKKYRHGNLGPVPRPDFPSTLFEG